MVVEGGKGRSGNGIGDVDDVGIWIWATGASDMYDNLRLAGLDAMMLNLVICIFLLIDVFEHGQ